MAHAKPHLRRHAREMRHAATRSENRLWAWLRARRFDGYKFRRQYPIGHYILDFYCAELKLAIEVDGRHHGANWMGAYEEARSLAVKRRGIEIVRISNELLIRDSVMVERRIRAAIERLQR